MTKLQNQEKKHILENSLNKTEIVPAVSVIVPVYNAEKFLRHCVDSIIAQTFSDFELILVDDGSKDNSGSICDEYAEKDRRISVIHKKNGGVSSARNRGISKAKGKYICFADSDDYLSEFYLQELLALAEQYPEYDNIWCGFSIVSDYQGTSVGRSVFSEDASFSLCGTEDFVDLHKKWLDPSPWNKLYVNDILKSHNIIFDTDISVGEDLLFNLKYLDCSNKKIALLNKTVYNYVRDGKESLDNKYYPNLFDVYKKVHTKMYKYGEKWGLNDESLNEILIFAFYKYEAALENTFSKDNNISKEEKYKYNNTILNSCEFQKAFKCAYKDLNILYKLAYTTKNYRFVRIVQSFIKILKR